MLLGTLPLCVLHPCATPWNSAVTRFSMQAAAGHERWRQRRRRARLGCCADQHRADSGGRRRRRLGGLQLLARPGESSHQCAQKSHDRPGRILLLATLAARCCGLRGGWCTLLRQRPRAGRNTSRSPVQQHRQCSAAAVATRWQCQMPAMDSFSVAAPCNYVTCAYGNEAGNSPADLLLGAVAAATRRQVQHCDAGPAHTRPPRLQAVQRPGNGSPPCLPCLVWSMQTCSVSTLLAQAADHEQPQTPRHSLPFQHRLLVSQTDPT